MHPILLALLVLALLAVVLLGLRPLRRAVLSAPIFNMYRKVLPQMSDTERDALEAGTVWWKASCSAAVPTGAACTPIRARACPTMNSASWTTRPKKPAAWSMTGRSRRNASTCPPMSGTT